MLVACQNHYQLLICVINVRLNLNRLQIKRYLPNKKLNGSLWVEENITDCQACEIHYLIRPVKLNDV